MILCAVVTVEINNSVGVIHFTKVNTLHSVPPSLSTYHKHSSSHCHPYLHCPSSSLSMGQSMCIGDQPARSNTAASLINSRVCLEEALRGNTQSCVRSDNSSSYKKNKVSLRTKKAIEILQKYGPSSFIEEESTSCIYKTIVDDTFSWKDNHHNKWSQADSCNMPSVVIVVHESSEIIACGGEVTD